MKKKIMSLVGLVLAVVLLVCSFAACGKKETAKSDLEYIKGKGKLIIGITDYEPMNYKDENNKWIGFDTEYAEAVCAKLGVEPVFVVSANWGEKYNEIKAKTFDCAWNGLTIDETAKLNSSLTKAYARNAQVVVMAKDKAEQFKTAESMKDLKFAVEDGSAGQAAAKDNGFENLIAVDDQTATLLEVKSGAADACIIDLTMANAVTGEGKSYENFAVVLELSQEEFGIACRKGSDLPAEIDRITEELKADGTLQKLAEKYNVVLVK